jgi:hypothetical protein
MITIALELPENDMKLAHYYIKSKFCVDEKRSESENMLISNLAILYILKTQRCPNDSIRYTENKLIVEDIQKTFKETIGALHKTYTVLEMRAVLKIAEIYAMKSVLFYSHYLNRLAINNEIKEANKRRLEKNNNLVGGLFVRILGDDIGIYKDDKSHRCLFHGFTYPIGEIDEKTNSWRWNIPEIYILKNFVERKSSLNDLIREKQKPIDISDAMRDLGEIIGFDIFVSNKNSYYAIYSLINAKDIEMECCIVCLGNAKNLIKFSGLKACGKCGKRMYCSKRCQKMDWPEHKLECCEIS